VAYYQPVLRQYVHKADYAGLLHNLKQAVQKKPFDVKRRLKSADGTAEWFAANNSIFQLTTLSNRGAEHTDIDDAERLQNDFAILPESLE
jgi:hypothetical protein